MAAGTFGCQRLPLKTADTVNGVQVDGSVAIITGAESGVGRALATAFADAGARVALGDVDETGVQQTAEQIRTRGARPSHRVPTPPTRGHHRTADPGRT